MCRFTEKPMGGETRDFACDVLRHALAMDGGSEDEKGGGGWRTRWGWRDTDDGLRLDGAVHQRSAEILRPTGKPATAAEPARGQAEAEMPLHLTKNVKIRFIPSIILPVIKYWTLLIQQLVMLRLAAHSSTLTEIVSLI